MKITIKNIIKENKDIDPKQRYINGISRIIKPPYYNFLKVNEIPRELWNDIFSKLFNTKVTYSDNSIHDSNNNVIYFEHSSGYWEKSEYDSNNNLIYLEDSDGFWYKQEYDENNNEIYYKNSNGVIRDNRPNNINENIDPKQRFVNKITEILNPPYFRFLRVNEIPKDMWEDILSKVFNQKVIIDNNIIDDENNNIIYYENPNGYWMKQEFDSNNNKIYYEDSKGYWIKRGYDENNSIIYYENSNGVIRDKRTNNINENIDPKQRYVNGIVNMIRRPYMEFLINNEVPEELWKGILSKIFNTNDISWEKRIIDNKILYQLIIENEKGRQLYYEIPDYWEQLIYGHHNRLDMDFTWYVNSDGSKKVTFIGKHSPVVYSNGPTGHPWSGLSDDVKNNKFFDLNY